MSSMTEALGLDAMLPVAHVQRMGSYQGTPAFGCLLSIEAEKRLRVNDPLYDRAALDRVLEHAREVHQFNGDLYAKNTALSLEVLDLRQALGDLVLAVESHPSCQVGIVARCTCMRCAMMAATKLLFEQAERMTGRAQVDPWAADREAQMNPATDGDPGLF